MTDVTDDSGELTTGVALGDYLLDDLLARGPFSEVWSGTHEDDVDGAEPVAIKIATHPLYTQWMADQQTFALTLEQENLLLANEIDFSEQPPFLVYDLVEGDSLGELIEMGLQFPQRAVLALVRQVAEGIAALHADGEFHGALKPRNVMLSDDGAVLILDTETARITRDIALFVRRTGTAPEQLAELLPYLAPEELAQPGRTDPRGDVFSLGALYYSMLTLEAPPEGGPTEAGLAGQPIQVQALILECCAPVEQRVADAGELLARLDRLASVLPTEEEEAEDEEVEEEGEEVEEDYEEFIGLDSDEFEGVQ